MATDHDTSVKAFAEELKALVDATQVSQGSDVVTVPGEFMCGFPFVDRARSAGGGDKSEEPHPEGISVHPIAKIKDLITNMMNKLRAITSLTVMKRQLRFHRGKRERLDC